MADLKVANTGYPSAVDTYTPYSDSTDEVVAAVLNRVLSAVVAIEGELGTLPKASAATVKARLAVCLGDNGGLASGTSFPGSPVDGQLYRRTDYNPPLIYQYVTSLGQWKLISSDASTLLGLTASASPAASTIVVSNASAKIASGWGGSASTLATLDTNTRVVEAANTIWDGTAARSASPTSAANVVPVANASGKIVAGFGGSASTIPTLDANVRVVEAVNLVWDGVGNRSASQTPAANTVAVGNASGKLASGWGGSASTLATLDGSTLVVQNPANAQTTSAAAKIPVSDSNGDLPGWCRNCRGSVVTGSVAAGATLYAPIAGDSAGSATEAQVQIIMPIAGEFRLLYAKAGTNSLSGNLVVTARKNASNQTLTCTITTGSTAAFSDGSNSFSFVAGDLISIGLVAAAGTGSATNITLAMVQTGV